MKVFRTLFACLVVAASMLASPRADALSYVMMRDDLLLAQSTGVGLFEVTSATAAPARRETRYGLALVSNFTDGKLGATETLALPGFVSDTQVELHDGIPLMQKGQRLLVFYARRDDGVLQSMQLTLGMFFPLQTKNGAVYVRYLDEEGDRGKGENAQFARARDAGRFEQWIRGAAKGLQADGDYLVDLPKGLEKYTLLQFGQAPGRGRWFQFANNQTMQWFAGAQGQTPAMVQDEFALLAAALAGWSDDPGSLIRMAYAGTPNNPPPQNSPSLNSNVYWDDPQNEIPGNFTCGGGGGTLGFGGPSGFTPTMTFAGLPWFQLGSGRLITQNGVGCFMDGDSGRNGIEFFVHEIGHVLGFGHSCDSGGCGDPVLNAATMRFQLHGDGRGATLGVDDIAAAGYVYPDSSPPPSANLALDLSAAPASIQPGQNVTYSIAVSNAGPSNATSVSVSHVRAAALTFVSATGTGWSCANSNSTVTCTRTAAGVGAAPVINVVAALPGNYAGASPLASQATVTSAVADPSNANNTDTASVGVTIVPGRIFGNGFE